MNANMPHVHDRYWIDRPVLLSQFEELLQSGKRLLLIDTVAMRGSGKTILLSQLYEKMTLDKEVQPLWLSLDLIRLSSPGEEEESRRTRHHDYQVFHNALRGVLEGVVQRGKLSKHVAQDFVERMDTLKSEILPEALEQTPSPKIEKASTGNVHIGAGANIRAPVTTGDVVVEMKGAYETILAEATENLRIRVTDEFVALVRDITEGKRYALLVDGFCSVIGMRVGGWILELLKQLDNVTVVVARTVTRQDLPNSHLVTQLELPAFSREEIDQYLRNRFGAIPDLDRLAEPIHSFSHGHPGTVSLAADSIRPDELADVGELIRFFHRVSGELMPNDPPALQCWNKNTIY